MYKELGATRQSAPLRWVRTALRLGLWSAAAAVIGVLVWQGIATHGSPDPTIPHTGRTAAVFDIGVLVFREGLECVLVLSAITASMAKTNRALCRPVGVGAAAGFAATLATWFIAVGVVNSLAQSVPALDLQAATGLLAVIVLLVVMNWFFHKIYWSGWISVHNRKKMELLKSADQSEITRARLLWGLGLLGFASFYREGLEVVLFLQGYRLQMGGAIVLGGTLVGLALTAVVAVLTFVSHRRLPYLKMLVLTGIMLGVVLIVMVGEQVQEMQLAHWIPTTTIPALADVIPAWMGLWLSVFPTVETLAGQAIAALLVIGSYSIAQRRTAALPTVLPSDNETPARATQTSVSEQTAPTRLQEAS